MRVVDPEHADPGSAGHVRQRQPRWRVRGCCGLILAGVLTALICRSVLNDPDPAQLAMQGAKLVDRSPDEAEQMLYRAIESTGVRLPQAEVTLCLLLARKHDWNSAQPLFARLDQSVCSDQFLLEFGRLAHSAGKIEIAVESLNVVRNRGSNQTYRALELLGQIHQERHEERELLDCVRDMALLTPGEPALWWKLLQLLDDRQLMTESIAHLRSALQQDLPQKDQIEMRHQLVSRLVGQGQISEARTELSLLPENERSMPRTERHRAALYRLEGRPELALASLELSQSLTTSQPGVAWLRGQVRFDLQQYAAAILDFQTVLKADAFDLTVHLKLAEACRETQQHDLAEQHEQTARSIREKRQQINRLKEKAIHQPDDQSLQLDLARLYRELNDQRAADYWEKRASTSQPAKTGA